MPPKQKPPVTVKNILRMLKENNSVDINTHELGASLGVPESTLGTISRNHSKDDRRQLHEVLTYFVNNCPHETAWEALADAFREMDKANVANKFQSPQDPESYAPRPRNNDPQVEVDHSEPYNGSNRKSPAAGRTIADSDDPVPDYNWWKVLVAILFLVCAFLIGVQYNKYITM